MITKYPNQSTISSEPLWISEEYPSLKTNHRLDYKGHFHSTKVPGPECLIARNKKYKVSAYLSTLPLSPPKNIKSGSAGQTWLADTFGSKEVKWRRGSNLHVSNDTFDGESNYQMQFTPKTVETRIKYIPKHIPLKTMEKFDSISTYNNDFENKVYNKEDITYVLQRRQPSDVLTWSTDRHSVQPPFYKRKELPPLESSTSYRTQFPTWPVTPRHYCKKLEENEKPIIYLPFDNESCYRADYTVKISSKPDIPIMSSCGFINRELNRNPVDLVPYLECQKTLFYNVNDKN